MKELISYSKLPRKCRGSFDNWRSGYWPLAILIAALYSALSYLVPYGIDDYTFMGNWKDDAANEGFSFAGWIRYYEFIRGYDNGRIANALAPIVTLFSPWKEIFPMLTGCMVGFIVVTVQRFSTGRPKLILLSLTWALLIVGIPWRDTIFIRDFALNYIWAAGVNLAFLRIIFKGENKGWTPWITVGACLLAILAGGWHESFSVATFCGLLLLIVTRRFRFTPCFYLSLGVFIASSLIFMLSPGILSRMAAHIANEPFRFSYRNYFILFLLAFTVLSDLLSREGRAALLRCCKSPAIIVSAGVVVSGYAIAISTTQTPRSFFWPDMAAVAVTVRLLATFPWDTLFRSKSAVPFTGWLKFMTAWLLIAGCTLQTLSVILWQARYYRENKAILALLEKSPNGIVFFDSSLPYSTPFYTLGIPVGNLWQNPSHYHGVVTYYNFPIVGVVPEVLRDAYVDEKADTIGGLPEARLYRGHIIAPLDRSFFPIVMKPEVRDLELTLPDGKKLKGNTVVIPFITDENDTLMYFFPTVNTK